jgi:hypothetical protein
MRIIKATVVMLTFVLFGSLFASNLRAQDDNYYLRLTKVTFNQQVEIPGRFLPAGTYMMEVMDIKSYRHVIRFWNADRTQVVATVMAIPNLRLEPSDKPIMTFEERPINQPEALKAWFYSGDTFGHEFVYPKRRAIELAQETKEPVLAFEAEQQPVTSEEMESAPIVAETPTAEEMQLSEAVELPVLVAQAQEPQEVREAPKTASMIPLIALVGMISIGLAFGVKRLAAKTHSN